MTRECPVTYKVRFLTQRDALSRLQGGLRSVDGSGAVPSRAYRCEHCDGWHLTHRPKRGAR